MFDSLASRVENLPNKRSITGLALNNITAGIFLISGFIFFVIPSDIADNINQIKLIIDPHFFEVILWSVFSLIFTPFFVYMQLNRTSEMPNPICNFCGAKMTTTSLVCIKCNSTSTKSK